MAIDNKVLTEADIDYLEKRFSEVFTTKEEFKQYRSDLMDKLDAILYEVQKSREEQTVIAHRSSDHGDRIEKLESIHPKGTHASL